MRLKNKKTGEIGYLYEHSLVQDIIIVYDVKGIVGKYKSITELCEEWEDAPEEPKLYWYIDDAGVLQIESILSSVINMRKSIGNYFNTREEAEKAAERLRAWKRLKDKGFRFDHIRSIDGVTMKHKDLDQYTIIAYADEDGCDRESLDLLFGGEE